MLFVAADRKVVAVCCRIPRISDREGTRKKLGALGLGLDVHEPTAGRVVCGGAKLELKVCATNEARGMVGQWGKSCCWSGGCRG